MPAAELKDAMASVVLDEVFKNPDLYPQAITKTDLAPNKDYAKQLGDQKEAIASAEKEGLTAVYPGENELQIDIDNEQSYLFFMKQYETLGWLLETQNFEEHPSKSGLPRRHITVRLRKSVTPVERICLQACLGSDRVRELLGYVRRKRGESRPTLFFEKENECPKQTQPSLWQKLKRKITR
jgi:hypothetical protein